MFLQCSSASTLNPHATSSRQKLARIRKWCIKKNELEVILDRGWGLQ